MSSLLARRVPRDPGRVPLRRRRTSLRRLASAVLVAAAVAAGLSSLRPAPPAGTTVLVMAHDVTAGVVLQGDDVKPTSRPRGQLPTGALGPSDDVVGRVLASPAREGEVLTDVRLIGPSLVDSLAVGQVAAPVRVADGAAAALVRPGDHVDVLTAVDGGGPASLVASDAIVLARPTDSTTGGLLGATADDGPGGLLLLAVRREAAQALAGAAARGPLSLTLRRG